MNNEKPQTEAEAMKIAAESWDTPVENNETTPETVAPTAENMEEDPMEMEIQSESAELEKNSEAVEKALADVGGVEGLQATIQEMPEDKKTAMVKKLQEEHKYKMFKIEEADKEANKTMDSATGYLNPFQFGKAWAEDMGIEKDDYFIRGILNTGSLLTNIGMMGTVQLGALGTGTYGALKHFKENFNRNREKRRHEKELKELEKTEA